MSHEELRMEIVHRLEKPCTFRKLQKEAVDIVNELIEQLQFKEKNK